MFIDSKTSDAESLLHWMAPLGDHVGILLLLEAGANVNAIDSDGNTPIHEAVSRRQASAVKVLRESGADICLRNGAGQTPFDIAKAGGYQPTIDLLESSR